MTVPTSAKRPSPLKVYDSPLISAIDPAAVFSQSGANAYQASYFSPVDSVNLAAAISSSVMGFPALFSFSISSTFSPTPLTHSDGHAGDLFQGAYPVIGRNDVEGRQDRLPGLS